MWQQTAFTQGGRASIEAGGACPLLLLLLLTPRMQHGSPAAAAASHLVLQLLFLLADGSSNTLRLLLPHLHLMLLRLNKLLRNA